MRINARLDKERAMKLRRLVEETQLSKTEIVKRAIDALFAELDAGDAHPAQTLAACGFIGCADGDSDLSESYKDLLNTGWDAKHADRR